MSLNNVTGFGFVLHLIASNTFPAGFTVTQASDDADAVDFPSVKFADAVMGVNGDPIVWNKAVMSPMTLSVIPGSLDDLNLQALAKANRVAQGKSSAYDTITATLVYPDKSVVTLTNGVMTDAQFGKGIGSNGRLKTHTYTFMFGGVV